MSPKEKLELLSIKGNISERSLYSDVQKIRENIQYFLIKTKK